jgi:hypothetical protein
MGTARSVAPGNLHVGSHLRTVRLVQRPTGVLKERNAIWTELEL